MLRHLGEPTAAERVEAAVRDVIARGPDASRPTSAGPPARASSPTRSSSGSARRAARAPARSTGTRRREPSACGAPRKPRRHRARGLRRGQRAATAGGSHPAVQGIVFTVCATYLFVSGILWTPLFGTAYEVDGYLSPLFSPLIAPGWLPTGSSARAC